MHANGKRRRKIIAIERADLARYWQPHIGIGGPRKIGAKLRLPSGPRQERFKPGGQNALVLVIRDEDSSEARLKDTLHLSLETVPWSSIFADKGMEADIDAHRLVNDLPFVMQKTGIGDAEQRREGDVSGLEARPRAVDGGHRLPGFELLKIHGEQCPLRI